MHKVMQATFSDCCGNLSKERTSETFFLFSDGLLAQTLRTAYVRSAHIRVADKLRTLEGGIPAAADGGCADHTANMGVAVDCFCLIAVVAC